MCGPSFFTDTKIGRRGMAARAAAGQPAIPNFGGAAPGNAAPGGWASKLYEATSQRKAALPKGNTPPSMLG